MTYMLLCLTFSLVIMILTFIHIASPIHFSFYFYILSHYKRISHCVIHSPIDEHLDYFLFMIPWKREWLPTPVFLLGKSYGQRSLVEYNPWGHQESDMSELTFTFQKTNVNKVIMNIYAKFSV